QLFTTNLMSLIDDVARVGGRQKLSFLDVDRLSGFRRSDDQISLSREKGRNLQNIDDLGNSLDLRDLVHVRQHRHTQLFLDVLKHFQAGIHSETAKALN